MKLARDRGVTGIAVWFTSRLSLMAIRTPSQIYGGPRKLSSKALLVDNEVASSGTNSKTRTSLRSRSSVSVWKDLGISTGITTMSSSGQKRGRR